MKPKLKGYKVEGNGLILCRVKKSFFKFTAGQVVEFASAAAFVFANRGLVELGIKKESIDNDNKHG